MLGKTPEKDLRRRRTGGQEAEEAVEPLDEDDQAKLIHQLQAEAVRQEESIREVFRLLCQIAAVVVVLSTLYMDQWHIPVSAAAPQALAPLHPRRDSRLASLAHGLCAAVLHSLLPHLTAAAGPASRLLRLVGVADVVAAVFALWVARRSADDVLLDVHYGFLASNVLVGGVGLWLQWDRQTSDHAVQDLRQAQYRYKSL
jgi:hypothetical protein